MEQKYLDNIQTERTKLKELQKRSAIYGNFRLLLALICLGLVALLIVQWFSFLWLSLLIVAVGGFVYLTTLHSEVSSLISYSKGLIDINEDGLRRISGEWKNFKDNGREFADYNHNYSHDLDVFGDKSLFQFINVTKTPFGRERLKNDLSSPSYSGSEIEERQEAIVELSQNERLCSDFQYHSRQIKYNKDLPKVINYVKEKPQFTSISWLKYILYPLPFVILSLCAVFMSIGTLGFRIAASVLMITQVLIWAASSLRTLSYLSASERIHYSLSDYSNICSVLEGQEFSSRILRRIKNDLVEGELSAARATKQLNRILQRIQIRTSGIMYIILNILFLWDIGCALSLSSWSKKYGENIEKWFSALGEFESLLSFSMLAGALDTKCMAETSDKKHTLSAKSIGHPLLNNGARVCNSFNLAKNINIVSGSNMSGKTTFLRTLGINMLLAKNGSFVCAEQMTFSNMEIVSSMRVSDDLMDGISTFYSELKKIKRIIEIARHTKDTLFLIDEIFRGTNSADRTAGAKAVIRRLKECNAYGLLTTHDLKLCEDADGVDIDNFNFSERYENGALKFDYKIHSGIAKTTNGEYLMRLIGIMN